MSVWFAIPSKRPPEECEPLLYKWHERGYKIALVVDNAAEAEAKHDMANTIISSPHGYRGYARSVNGLVALILKSDPQAEWIVTGGDDVEPDPNHSAEEIARECSDHFHGVACTPEATIYEAVQLSTFGVMQATGDRWGDHPALQAGHLKGAYIDRVCGSPWMGREFCRRMYQGNGPLFAGYYHMFEDEELFNVATKLGVLWQRPDLTQYHRHWARAAHGDPKAMPEFLRKVSGPEHWAEARSLFETRKAGGFPGHEPIL